MRLWVGSCGALTGPEQGAWLVRLEREHDNLRAALHWLAETGDIEREARLCVALLRFWSYLGYLVEGDQWFAETLTRGAEANIPALLQAKLLQGAGMLAWNRGDPARSQDFSQQALVLFQEAGDDYQIAGTLHNLGAVAELHGDYPVATRHYQEALHLREKLGDKAGAATTLHNLGNVAREQSQLDRAAAVYERSLALQKEVGNKRGIALATSSLGVVALDKQQYALAAALSQESLDVYQQLGERSLSAVVFQNLGYAVMFQGD
jgi:non-specific serine/threonine protein kinase